MSTLDEPFSGLLVDACNGHVKRGGQDEAPRLISSKVDPGDDVDIVVGKAVAGIPAHMKKCVLKASCIAACKELFGIGRIAPPAKGRGSASLRSSRPSSLRIEP
jgi:NAD-dependent dihydropyrimidine dehydrogenase PreA subunit